MFRSVAALLVCGPILFGQQQPITARQVIDRIKEHVGVPWRTNTVDTFKAGDPDTAATGIATTMMATMEVLQHAAASGLNLIITHEPTFYSHLDRTEELAAAHDPVWAAKEAFIKEHKLVVWRFHDHWHMRRPDGIQTGITRVLGWQAYQSKTEPSYFVVPETTLDRLAASLRSKLGNKIVRVVGDPRMSVTRVAMRLGASGFASHRGVLQRDDVEVLLIGEVPEWETIEYAGDEVAEGKRKALILLGHIPSEQAGMEDCAEWLKTFVTEAPVKFVPASEPFWLAK